MTEFKDGDKVRATSGENVIVGELRYWADTNDDYFDIKLDDGQFAQLKWTDWTLELIKPPEPTTEEILGGLKIGTRFKYEESLGYWIKISTDGYIYVPSDGYSYGNIYHAADHPHRDIVMVED